MLLDALKLLKDLGINFECHIVGEGDYKESILYARYQLKLIECVKLNGHLSQDKIRDEMDWADIYIQPSIEEGFCNLGSALVYREDGGKIAKFHLENMQIYFYLLVQSI